MGKIKDLEVRTEKIKEEINTICDHLQLTAEKKKESMETYNALVKPFKTLRWPPDKHEEENDSDDETDNWVFPRQIYLSILRKTATGK